MTHAGGASVEGDCSPAVTSVPASAAAGGSNVVAIAREQAVNASVLLSRLIDPAGVPAGTMVPRSTTLRNRVVQCTHREALVRERVAYNMRLVFLRDRMKRDFSDMFPGVTYAQARGIFREQMDWPANCERREGRGDPQPARPIGEGRGGRQGGARGGGGGAAEARGGGEREVGCCPSLTRPPRAAEP